MVSEVASTTGRVADAPADLKARLALAALQGQPEPWNSAEAQQAGVTPADVVAWKVTLTARAAELFVSQEPDLEVLKKERDALQAQLTLRFEEMAVLTRLLSDKARFNPLISWGHLLQTRGVTPILGRQMPHRFRTLQIQLVRAVPRSWKRRVGSMIARNRT